MSSQSSLEEEIVPVGAIAEAIVVLRGQKVILDADLARLYSVSTTRLNEQVRRNRDKFPSDFMFQLTPEELRNLMSQIATSSWGGRRKPSLNMEHSWLLQS